MSGHWRRILTTAGWSGRAPRSLLLHGYFHQRLVAWIASTICWLYVLRVAPLSIAYGLTSLTYVLILMASVFLFGEQVRRLHVVGTVLIVIGIACLLSGD